jgi:hypothetical protein
MLGVIPEAGLIYARHEQCLRSQAQPQLTAPGVDDKVLVEAARHYFRPEHAIQLFYYALFSSG